MPSRLQRCICIHGHFYQPPRENPWLGTVLKQPGAEPYHDWNERVTAECYAPNAFARILADDGWIRAVVNNYARLSFDFGPTLLSWMESHAPRSYARILEADLTVAARSGGHGPAMAQAYNHMIMPLANARDRRTQVAWGLADFRHRFGRAAEGMWLPETAVDTDTLEALAEAGVRFTVLGPSQARRVRLVGRPWSEVREAGLDTRRPYFVQLPSGRSLSLFFYDGALSRAVAFDGMLRDGRRFADTLLRALGTGEGPALLSIATDGETYGHHHAHGDMALAYALEAVVKSGRARVVTYAEYLAEHPAVDEVEIDELSSWSCAHGVERWRADCGCSTGGRPGWNQAWRAPLRRALDDLRDAVAEPFAAAAAPLLNDPWAARDAYIDVVLDRGSESLARFFATHAVRPLSAVERVTALTLLELQHNAMLMYTSCGWFFSDLAGIETVQLLLYAARVAELAERCLGLALEPGLLDALAGARSNDAGIDDGAALYRSMVPPARVALLTVAAHYAVSSLFRSYHDEERVYEFNVAREAESEERSEEPGGARLVVGRLRVTSTVTGEAGRFRYAVLHRGDLDFCAGVQEAPDPDTAALWSEALSTAFRAGDYPAAEAAIAAGFGGAIDSLGALFRDEQEQILTALLGTSVSDIDATFRGLHQRHEGVIRLCAQLGAPLPAGFRTTVEFLLNTDLARALAAAEPDWGEVEALLARARASDVRLAAPDLAFALRRNLDGQMRALVEGGAVGNPGDLARITSGVGIATRLPFEVQLWQVQNGVTRLLEGASKEPADDAWRAALATLAAALHMRLEAGPT